MKAVHRRGHHTSPPIFIRQNPDCSGLCRSWRLEKPASPHFSPHPGWSIAFRPAANFSNGLLSLHFWSTD